MRLLAAVLACAGLLAGLLYWIGPKGDLLADVPFGVAMNDSSGRLLRAGLAADDKYRFYVSLDQIAPEAVAATLEYEDKWFYQHPGVNIFALPRALLSFFGPRRIGASTLTMQVARLKYRLRTDNIAGKLRQILLALAIEMRHTKQEILEAYFNLAPYGGNVEGIEAASLVYFHKPASKLTREESLGLAVVPQNPVSRNPSKGQGFARARQRQGQAARLAVYSPADLPFLAQHLSLELAAGQAGKTITATLELDIQTALEAALKNWAERNSSLGLTNASALILRWTDMAVTGLAGSADFNSDVICGQNDGTRARRSPGSTLKPFIYALALEQGLIHPASILPDTPRSFGGYDPENFDRGFSGPVASHEALKASRNLPAIYLAERLKEPGLYGFLRDANVEFASGPEHYGLALVLGGAEVSMRELAALYAMLANQGIWQPLRFVRDRNPSGAKRLLSREAAWLTLHMLERPGATVRSRGREIPMLYKTGTSNGLRDAWTVGIVGQYVLAVWVGNFDSSPNPLFIGARSALPLFEEIAQQLAIRRQLEHLPGQNPADLRLARAEICAATGDINHGQCAPGQETWLIPGISPPSSGILRAILVDEQTGLRSCAESRRPSRKIWWEFWPSDFAQVFAKAGIDKAEPPQWLPECRRQATARKAPEILSPKKNTVYLRRLAEQNYAIALEAASDADAGRIHWYAGTSYIASSKPGQTVYWHPLPGSYLLRAVDETGASSARECRIEAVP